MMRSSFLICALILGPGASTVAASPRALNLSRATEVRRVADPTVPVTLELPAGARVWIVGEEGEFTKIKVQRRGGWKQGFVFTEDLAAPDAGDSPGSSRSSWGVGVLGQYSALDQGGRQFQTQDAVQWRTSTYSSRTTWPSIFVQYRRENFWRLSLGLRQVHFRGQASADVGIVNSRALTVDQTMYSGRLEKAFGVYKLFYLILGLEAARGTRVTETLGGVTVPTTAEDISVYAGGSAGVGLALVALTWLTVTAEARYAAFPSVKPTATAVEAVAGLTYWF